MRLPSGYLCEAFDPNDLGIKDLSEEQDLSLKLANDTESLGAVQGGYNWQMPNWLGSECPLCGFWRRACRGLDGLSHGCCGPAW